MDLLLKAVRFIIKGERRQSHIEKIERSSKDEKDE